MERARVGVLAALTLAVIAGGLYAIYTLSADCGFGPGCEYDSYYPLNASEAGERGFVYYATMEEGAIVKERAMWKRAAPTMATTTSDGGQGNESVEFTVAVTMNGVLRDRTTFHLPDGSGVVFWDSHATGARVAAGDVFDVAIFEGDMEDASAVHRARVHIRS